MVDAVLGALALVSLIVIPGSLVLVLIILVQVVLEERQP